MKIRRMREIHDLGDLTDLVNNNFENFAGAVNRNSKKINSMKRSNTMNTWFLTTLVALEGYFLYLQAKKLDDLEKEIKKGD